MDLDPRNMISKKYELDTCLTSTHQNCIKTLKVYAITMKN